MKHAFVAIVLAYFAVAFYGRVSEKRTFVCDVATDSPNTFKCRQIEEPKQ
jgi:hypothetical protein